MAVICVLQARGYTGVRPALILVHGVDVTDNGPKKNEGYDNCPIRERHLFIS